MNSTKVKNIDPTTVAGFGVEWTAYDQGEVSAEELQGYFRSYFAVFPWDELPQSPVGFDLGCGSGRWAKYVAPRVAQLHCIDASAAALAVAKKNLAGLANCQFHCTSVDEIPIADDSMDFCYSLGVLHHVPDTALGVRSCVEKLKPGAPMLLYLYYRFDNRPLWFRTLWRLSDAMRRTVSKLPDRARIATSTALAAAIYFPLGRFAAFAEQVGVDVSNMPLSAYRNSSFYTMRTDALDRFGTALEQRFTRAEIAEMMQSAGLENIRFSEELPYWCAVGTRAR